jgi:hypothetical protein
MHRRVRSLIDASFCVQSGMDRSPFEENSAEWRGRRDAILEGERIMLHTLEFDAAVEQPYPLITAALRKWKEQGMFGGSRFDKIPELQALDKAAGTMAFICIAASESLPLLFTSKEIAYGSLYVAYQLSSAAVQHRLKIPESAFSSSQTLTTTSSSSSSSSAASTAAASAGLLDARLLVAFTERVGEMITALRRSEERLHAAVPLTTEVTFTAANGADSSTTGNSGGSGGGFGSLPLSSFPPSIIEALGARFGINTSGLLPPGGGLAGGVGGGSSRRQSFASTMASVVAASAPPPSVAGSSLIGGSGGFGASLLAGNTDAGGAGMPPSS